MSSVPDSGSRVFKRHSFRVLILSGGQQKLGLLTRNWCQMLCIVLAVHAPLPHLERIGICPLKVAHVEMGGWGGMHIDPLLPPISVPIGSKTLSSETLNELSSVVCQVGDRGKI